MRRVSRDVRDQSDQMDQPVHLVHLVQTAHVVKMANQARKDHRVNVVTQDQWEVGLLPSTGWSLFGGFFLKLFSVKQTMFRTVLGTRSNCGMDTP